MQTKINHIHKETPANFYSYENKINNDFLKQVELKFYSMLDCYRYKNTISKIYARVLTSRKV